MDYLNIAIPVNIAKITVRKIRTFVRFSSLFEELVSFFTSSISIPVSVFPSVIICINLKRLAMLYNHWYLFSWDEIPENDSGRLRDFLKQNYSIDWVKIARIEKIDDGKTIRVSTEKNFLLLKLNNDKTEINLKIDDCRSDKFVVKIENGKLNIYKGSKNIEIYKKDKEGSNEAFGEEIDREAFQDIKLFWGFTKKIDYLYNKGILKDFSHRVLDEANEVRNKIHDPSIVAPFSEQDRTLFHIARVITYNILIATRDDFGETISANIKSDAEKFDEQCLLTLNYE